MPQVTQMPFTISTAAAIRCRLNCILNLQKLEYAATIATGLFAKACLQSPVAGLRVLKCKNYEFRMVHRNRDKPRQQK